MRESSLRLRRLDLLVDEGCRRLLNTVRKTTSFAVVAGGYLRDCYYQVPPKDLDVFTCADFDRKKLLKLLGDDWAYDGDEWQIKEAEAEPKSGYRAAELNFQVLNLTTPNKLPAQIISSSEYTCIENVLEQFDFGFCQIAYDGHWVMMTDAFWQDADQNTATYLAPKCGSIGHANEHFQRLKSRYPKLQWIWNTTPKRARTTPRG